MSRPFVQGKICFLGRSNAGKTKRLLDIFIHASSANQSARFILPSSGFAEHIKDRILSRLGQGTISEDQITTFDRMARSLLLPGQTLAAPAELMPLVQALLQNNRPAGFGKVIDLPGFSKSLLVSLIEMLQNNVAPKDLRSLKVDRLTALADILELFSESMAKTGFVLSGQLLFRLATALQSQASQKGDLILFDGFTDFTSGQKACFETLAHRCPNMRFTLPAVDEDFPLATFSGISKTHRLLQNHGFDFETIEPTFALPCGLQAASTRLFSRTTDRVKPDGIRLMNADTPEILIESIACKIVADKTDGQIEHWHQAGVTARSLAPYADLVKRVFTRYGIPVSIHTGISPTTTAHGPALQYFFSAAGDFPGNTRQERAQHIEALVNASFAFCSPRTSAALSAAFSFSKTADGSFSRRKVPPDNVQEWAKGVDSKGASDHLASIEKVLALAQKRKIAFSAFSDIVYETLAQSAKHLLMDRVGDFAMDERTAGTIRAFSRALDRACQIARVLNLPNAPWNSHMELFTEFLDSESISLDVRLLDAVHVVDALQARSWTWKDLYLIGMVNGEFPRKISENLFCRDADRKLMGSALPTARFSRRNEELIFRLCTGRATRSLTLCTQRYDDTGKEIAPSFFLDELKSLYEPAPGQLPAIATLSRPVSGFQSWPDRAKAHEAAAFSCGRLFHFNEKASSQNQIGHALFANRLAGAVFPKSETDWILFGNNRPGSLPKDMSGQVRNSLEPFSVSAIETFIACPFRSFANRLLRPATRPCSPELDAMLLGNIAHETLQKYHAGWRLEKSPPDLHALFRSIKNNRTMGLDLSFDDEQDLLRLEGALVFLIETQHDQQKRFDITAERFEWAFGSKTEPLELEHNHRTLPFTGRIDRVEQIGDAYFVLDYKLSSGRIGPKDLPALAAGLLPQLPIYCMAAKQELGFAVAGGQIQRVRQIDRSGFANEDACPASALALFDETDVSVLSDSEYTETIASALDGVFDFCDQMLNGQMEVAPRDPSKTCSLDRCDYFDLCRVSR